MGNLAALILRVVLGGLMAGHGAQKLFGSFSGPGLEGTSGFMEMLGLKPGRPWAWLAGLSEFGGGVLTMLGLLNPLGPIGVIGSMTMATTTAHAGKPIWVTEGGAELPVTNIAASTALIVNGPGKWSLDRALGLRLPGWLAPLGLIVVILAVIYGRPGGEPEPEQDEAREGTAGNGEGVALPQRMNGDGPGDPKWLPWVKRLQAIAQDGLTYSEDGYDVGRYEQLREIAAEMLAAHSTGSLDEVRELLELQTGPATPKVDVRGAVFDGDAILLIKEPDDGGWSLPGGWADVGESPAEAIAREVYEESGYRVRVTRLLSAYDRDRHGHPPSPYYVYKLNFLCEVLDHDPSVAAEADGIGFFAADAIPPLSLPRVTPAQIERFFEHYRNPNFPTDFD